ncbi:MAG: hypothetical protein K0S58_3401 [Nitrospira sp.]|jgi:hypothetical protein|nr:hypothetical protein [Nitrospira sp.]
MALNMAGQRKNTVPTAISLREQFALDTLQLQQATWADEKLARIDTEDLALEAYMLSDPLKREFGGEEGREVYLAYWRALRRKGGINGCSRRHR